MPQQLVLLDIRLERLKETLSGWQPVQVSF